MEQALFSSRDGKLNGKINPRLVIASKDGIPGIKKALDFGMRESSVVVCPRNGRPYDEWGEELLRLLGKFGIELIAQFGFIPIMPANVIEEYRRRIFNQHPVPLDIGFPDFGGKGMHGLRAQGARLLFSIMSGREEDMFTEATSHFVEEEVDKGDVIGRRRVPILEDDHVEKLAERVLPVEHELQIDVLEQFADGTVEVQTRETRLIAPDRLELLEYSKKTARIFRPNG